MLPSDGGGKYEVISTARNSTGEVPWVDRLARFLRDESGVEAILLERDSHRVSLATIGQVEISELERKLSDVLRELDESALSAPLHAAGRDTGPIEIRELPNRSTLLEKPSCPTAPLLWKWREFEWPEPEEIERQSREEWQWLALQAGLCGGFLLAGWSLARLGVGPAWIPIVCYVVSLVSGAWDASIDAWAKIRKGQLDIHFLMLAVAAGAASIGAWTEGALLLFLFSLSGALEHYALHRTHREIRALTESAPDTGRVVDEEGRTRIVEVSRIEIGNRISVRPDEKFPVDGVIIEGDSAADESNLTGESNPVSKAVGDEVYSGTLNLWGVVTIRTTKKASESALQKIINLIQEAQHLRAPSQRFTDRFGTGYTYAILGTVTVMFFVWWLVFDLPAFASTEEGEFSALYRSMTLLVVASPCALVLSIPSAILAAIAWAARKGILFRGGAAIEKLSEIDTVALDKTGTLTTGELEVEAVESFPAGNDRRVIELAFALEANSNHPIARAICRHGERDGLERSDVAEFRSLTGKGLRGRIGERTCYLGRRELLQEGRLGDFARELPEPPVECTEVWVVHEELVGRILLRDTIRENSRGVLDWLAERGIKTMMLTGDRRGAAETVARELGVREVRAGLAPADKVRIIEQLTREGRRVAMVGDGVNDAPSLAAADVSIAMGGHGSDSAMEQSDVVLMQDRIEKLVTAIQGSDRARRIIRQNLAISLGTIVVMIAVTLAGQVHLTHGVLAHEGSTVLVCLNSLRLLFAREAST